MALATEQGPDGQQPTTIYDIDVKNAQGETVSLSVWSLFFMIKKRLLILEIQQWKSNTDRQCSFKLWLY